MSASSQVSGSRKDAYSLHHDTSDTIRVRIACRSPVLKITFTFLGTLSRDTNTRTTIRDGIAEFVDGCSLMFACHSLGVTLSVDQDVLFMAFSKLLACILNCLHAAIFPHLRCGDVGMQASAVPVPFDWLGLDGDLGSEFFSHAVKEIASYPKMISDYAV